MKTAIWNKFVTQLIATSAALVLIVQTGIIDGWTSPNMARFTGKNATIPLTPSEASWLVSCLKLGRFVSVILVPVFIELAGSKKSIVYTFIPVSVAWILTTMARSAMLLYMARFLSGITYGLVFGCFSIYLAEIAVPAYRGTFISISLIGWPIGTVVSTVGETYLPKIVSGMIYLVACLLGMLLFAWLPESPYQLVKNKKPTKARDSLVWYRGSNDVDTEMEEIIEFVESSSKVSFAEKIKQLKSPAIRNAVILVALVFAYPQMCGFFNIIYYMEIILTNGRSYLINPSQMVIYTDIIVLVFTLFTININDKLGRRTVLITSSVVITVALFILGLHYYLLNSVTVDPVNIQGLPIVSMIMLLVTFTIGYTPAMSALLGEMFSSSIKSTAAMIVTFVSAFSGLISTKAYQPLIDAIGEYCLFWTYAGLLSTLIPILIFFLPETKGKSLQDIQKVLNKV